MFESTLTTKTPSTDPAFPFSSSSSVDLLASRESFGFFHDIIDIDWIRKKKIAHFRTHVSIKTNLASWYYQSNWNPDFSCGEMEMIGTRESKNDDDTQNHVDAAHWLCDPWRLNKKGCVVYSIMTTTTTTTTTMGTSHETYAFERALKARAPLCDIHVFDTTTTMANDSNTTFMTFHHVGLKGTDGTFNIPETNRTSNNARYQTLSEIMHELGHVKIDYLKLDCDSCEWAFYRQLVGRQEQQEQADDMEKRTQVDVRQMTIVFHNLYHHLHHDIRKRSPSKTTEAFQFLHDHGYVIFHKDPNLIDSGGQNVAFGFLKLLPSFHDISEYNKTIIIHY